MGYVDVKRLLPNTALVLRDYDKYFKLYKHEEIDWNLFYTQFSQNWHEGELESSDIEYYKDAVFTAIANSDADDADKALLGIIQREYAEEVSKACTQSIDVSKLRQIIDMYEDKVNKISRIADKDVHTIDSVDFEVLDKKSALEWFLPSLQHSLLGISEGQFIIVSADYGTGKSAFVINQIVHSFVQLSRKKDAGPILMFNSEGTAADVFGRFLSNLYKNEIPGGFEEIVERRDEVKEMFTSKYNTDMFKCIQVADVGNFNGIKQKVLKYKPSLVIIDICDKLAKEEDVQSLKKLYDDLRVLASVTCPIIGTSQSGDTSYYDGDKKEVVNKKWLGDHDLYGSKTGKGGAAETMIMIGKDVNSSVRYVSVTKKKRGQPVRIVCELIDKYSEYRELNY